MSAEKLGFEYLETNVINLDKCCSCGGCEAACPIGAIELQNLHPTLVKECNKCEFCWKSCPRMINDYTPIYHQVYGDDTQRDPYLGVYRQAYALRNADESIRKRAQDGGVVTAILLHLLDGGAIEGAVVSGVDPNNPWKPKPQVATTRNEVISATKSRYTRSPNLVALKEAIKDRKLKQIAVVGTPCHIQAIQRMRLAPLKRIDRTVVLTIGLFCSETFKFKELMEEKIAGELGVPLSTLRKLDIKGKLLVYPRGAEESLKIPLSEAKNWIEPGCHECKDFASEFADISVGGAGTPGKWSTVLARSERGQAVIDEMIAAGVFLYEELSEEALERLRKIAAPKVG
ncbi:MAG: Coenzyme F420 hydrogenase/dehydrogenase, beta subunit C-terminal domain [Candidatus Thorarchaeota archaeon]